MGRLSQSYSLEQLAGALRAIGEEPCWTCLPNSQHQHKSARYKAVVNIWTSKGTVHVQGGGAQRLEDALRSALGEQPNPSTISAPSSILRPAVPLQATWHLYVDGSCPKNQNVRENAVPAGWGVAVFCADHSPDKAFSELYGPVVVDSSALSLGADVGSNNTGELSAVGEALLWLRDEAPQPRTSAAVIHYDSEYAANIAMRRNRAHKNQALAATVQALCDEVRSMRPLEFVHVKGHSGDPGNELADKLANKGAEGLHSSSSQRWRTFQPMLSCTEPSAGASLLRHVVAMPSTPTPQRRAHHMSVEGEPAAKIRRLSREGPGIEPLSSFAPEGATSSHQTDVPSLPSATDPASRLLFGPLRGTLLTDAAVESPATCAKAMAALQSFVCGTGMWEQFLQLDALSSGQRRFADSASRIIRVE